MLKVDIHKCDGDGLCTSVCPVEATHIDDNTKKTSIDLGLCMECYACMNICPQSAIYETDVE